MKAVQFKHYGGPEVLQIVDLPDPHPGPGQVRIRVHAAGISASDTKIRRGELSFGATLPQTTGADVAGVVDEIGDGVTDVAVGDRVFGISDDQAAAAEFALLSFRAPIPPSLGFVDAAGDPGRPRNRHPRPRPAPRHRRNHPVRQRCLRWDRHGDRPARRRTRRAGDRRRRLPATAAS